MNGDKALLYLKLQSKDNYSRKLMLRPPVKRDRGRSRDSGNDSMQEEYQRCA